MSQQKLTEFSPASSSGIQDRKPPGAVQVLPTFSRLEVFAVVAVGIIANLVVVLQPIVLGPLAAEGRLTLREMGQTAMFESFGIALAVALSGTLLRPRKLKLIVAIAAVTSVLANVVSAAGSHEVIQLARLVNGLTVGITLWVWTGLLLNIALPARNVAIFLAVLAAGALAFSTLLSTFVLARWGGSAAYAIMAFLGLVNVFLALCVPTEYPSPAREGFQRIQLPSARGFVGLIAVLMYLAGVMAVWVYALPLGKQMGLSPNFVNFTISVSLGAEILGGLAGAMCARMNAKVALYLSVAASLGGLALIISNVSPAVFLIGLTIIAFFFMFAPGFQMPYLLEVDPSRGAGLQMTTGQQLGFSVGPALAALFIHDGSVWAALIVSGLLFSGCALLVFATTTLGPRGSSPRAVGK